MRFRPLETHWRDPAARACPVALWRQDRIELSATSVADIGCDVTASAKIGAKGFEPSTSASRTQRSSQAELRPAEYAVNRAL